MFSKILIANRGEIAVRIIRACKEMGISTVAVYSEEDKDALHVALAEESICVGSVRTEESYLNEDAIISAAMVTGSQAIHPGYGFLSENSHFARKCRKNGIAFIGPDDACMELVGDKVKIKEAVIRAGLDVIPGTGELSSCEEAEQKADSIGYPLMLKARFGGGGRGIRLVHNSQELKKVYELAVAESEAAFGDRGIYIEKYINPAKHIEVQVLADETGKVICFGERDCSIQRHHQKLIEETPSMVIRNDTRKYLLGISKKAVKELGYTGVGTLEFLMDAAGKFWFLEINARLQVEHSVTEMLSKIDLVKWQIRVAAGKEVDFSQEEVDLSGTAIECRINATSPGVVDMLHIPGGPNVRFDTYLYPGGKVSPYYDSLVGKLVVYAAVREEAVRKMKAALCELVISGISTNIEEQLDIISDKDFLESRYDVSFMEKY